jgi:DtxR family transcriptional regulator, Mn-dependent transcriptional regulator
VDPAQYPDPGAALLWFAALVVLAAAVGWPRRGLVARLLRLRRAGERVQVEDALKHLINCELAGEPGTTTGLAGALEVSRARAHELAGTLVARGFAVQEQQGLALTQTGRGYGLRVLRTHRLLERFFADRTGLGPGDWHDLAEAREHSVSAAEAEALAARMGDPPLDPHGDPIPTAEGRLPPPRGESLAALEPGATATVVHLEDEPEPVFRRLVALGFHPSVPVKLVHRDDRALEVLVGGRAVRLEAPEAQGVTVQRVPEAATHTVLFERLDTLRPGERAEVVQIAPALQGAQRRRLLDLGVLPGTEVVAEIASPVGDPVAYRVRGALIALRRPQAGDIYIRRRGPSAAGPGGEAA